MDDDPIVRALSAVGAQFISAWWAWETLSEADRKDPQKAVSRYHLFLNEFDPRKPIKIEHKSR